MTCTLVPANAKAAITCVEFLFVLILKRWAVDNNTSACETLKLNHPETEVIVVVYFPMSISMALYIDMGMYSYFLAIDSQVRNEEADNFLSLLKEWVNLCKNFSVAKLHQSLEVDGEEEEDDNSPVPSGEFEVGKLLAICYGDPNKLKKSGLHFKVIMRATWLISFCLASKWSFSFRYSWFLSLYA